jgi:hypothetical protein
MAILFLNKRKKHPQQSYLRPVAKLFAKGISQRYFFVIFKAHALILA